MKKNNYLPILFVFLVTGVMLGFNTQLKFNYNFEDFFQAEDEDVIFYRELREQFEDDSNFLLVGVKNSTSVFDSSFLYRVDEVYQKLKLDTTVQRIYSPTRLKKYFISPMGSIRKPILSFKDPKKYQSDSAYIYQSPHLVEQFFSTDGKSLALSVKAKENITREETKALIAYINACCEDGGFEEFHVAGKLKAQEYYIQKTEVELITFSAVSLVLIVVFLFLTYRSFWLLVIPLCVVGLAVVWSTGTMVMGGKYFDLLMSLLPSIMFVVGMSDVIHFFSKYIEELRRGTEKHDAITKTVKEVGKATFLTSVTTAIGFFSLYFINIKPIRDFGLYCGFGVLFAFIITILLLPPLLRILPAPRLTGVPLADKLWNKNLPRLLSFVLLKRKIILIIFGLVTIVSLAGIQQVRINTKLIDDLREDDPLKQDFLFFEKNFSGARPFELAVYLGEKQSSFFEKEVLTELDMVTTYLHDVYGVKSIVSPDGFIKGMNQALNAGLPKYYELPANDNHLVKAQKYVANMKRRPEFKLLLNEEQGIARVTGRISDIGSEAVALKNEAFREYISKSINADVLKIRVTGSALLIDENNGHLAGNMMLGLIIAFGTIAVIMGFLFRSLKMVFISLIPNIIPLCILGGLLGFCGIDLKLSTSIIFTVAFGIAVDDTIHFMSRYKMEREKGRSMLYAIKRTFISTGKALMITSFILSSGFMSLMLSSFLGTFYTGLFISLTLFFALIADLLLLPVLLLFMGKENKVD